VNYLTPESRAVRVIDQLLDLLLVGILLGAPLIFYTHGHDVFEFNKLTAVRALSSLAGVLMLAKLLFVRPLALARNALDLPVIAWTLVCLVATVHTVNWRLSVHGVYEDFEGITTWIDYIFLFYLASQHVRSERQIRLVLGTVALAGTAMGFYGLLQNFGIDFVPWNPDTYSKTRMFSTMGNPNFLAAYCVMSMPITFALFLDLPERIRTNQAFCAVLIVLGALASVGLCSLFSVNYFNFDPAFYEASSFAGMLVSQKFIATKVLLAFPLTFAVMMYFGRLRWVLLLSLLFQLVSTLFTKSRGGVISIAVIVALFVGAAAWDLGRRKALLALLGVAAAFVAVFASGAWRWLFESAFQNWRLPFLALLAAALTGLYRQRNRPGVPAILRDNAAYLVALVALVWVFHFNDAMRDTSFQMLDRMAMLFDFHQFKYTPRLFIWRSALAMLQDNFLLGKGLDTFQISFPPYRLVLYWILEWNGTPEKGHNFFMQTAATMGFAGLISFVWLFAAFTWSSVLDWSRQTDEKRRLLILASFAAVAAFATQNFFSFTVVGYGALWWVLMGFIPAMSRTWDSSGPSRPSPSGPSEETLGASGQAPVAAGGGSKWTDPGLALKLGILFLGCSLLAGLLVGPSFRLYEGVFQPQIDSYLPGHPLERQTVPIFLAFLNALTGWPVRLLATLIGLAGLGWTMISDDERPTPLARALFVTAALGGFFFSWHSVRIWVADSFYKQGQVGVSVNQVGYAVAMYQKAAGHLVGVSPEQVNSIHFALTPSAEVGGLKIEPGLNPDQELYWVKMGIAYEAAAGSVQPTENSPAAIQAAKEQKLNYYRTALAIHQLTLEMNPINGYNFNNKGRVLRTMGETFGDPGYFVRALDHYDRAIALDVNNAYFILDKANTLLSLGRTGEAFDLCQAMSEKFVDFAIPRSYQGFIKMRAGDRKQAIKYFSEAVKLDWHHDLGSRALAATNLGMLQGMEGNDAGAVEAYQIAIESNPGFPEAYLNLARQHLVHHRTAAALAVLQAGQKILPNDPRILQQLGQFKR
jgi:tetratricopeptide (TPR) repeat protein